MILLGAAGRDFHDFNVYWKQRDDVDVVCFTATQIPNIDQRRYPPELAGPRYPEGIPIHPEAELEHWIDSYGATDVALAYSDLAYDDVMHLAARAQARGASFHLLGPDRTMIRSSRPVVAVCAVRTGCGKSQTARAVAGILRARGLRVAVVRHPMPYGDLRERICQRFATPEDLDRHACTIEEREEYEPHLEEGGIVFAGVDYEAILRQAEREADVILWDGGNNDLSFYRPDLQIVVADPHRAGHESLFYPGETNVRLADVLLINKVDSATAEQVAHTRANLERLNPGATLLLAASPVDVDTPEVIRGKRVMVVEDGPTLTHGGMAVGAGHLAAQRLGAEILDPRPYARGSLREVYRRYDHLTEVIPAMGYGAEQVRELEATLAATPAQAVVIGTPIDLRRVLRLPCPAARVRYSLRECEAGGLERALAPVFETALEPAGSAREE